MGFRHKIIRFSKFIFVLSFMCFFSAFFAVAPALADPSSAAGTDIPAVPSAVDRTGLQKAFDVSPGSPLEATAVKGGGFNTSATFKTIIGKIITMVLELMGVMFLVLAIFGGFKWMTAGGNEESVEKAKKMITNATIGLIIVLAAYALTRFIVDVMGQMAFK